MIALHLSTLPDGPAISNFLYVHLHKHNLLPCTTTYNGKTRQMLPHEIQRLYPDLKVGALDTLAKTYLQYTQTPSLFGFWSDEASTPTLESTNDRSVITDAMVLRARELDIRSLSSHKLLVVHKLYEEVACMVGHLTPSLCLAFDKTGSFCFTGSDDGHIKVWDLETGWLIRNLRGHMADISFLTVNAENTMLASGSCDGTVRVWCLATGFPVATLRTKIFDPTQLFDPTKHKSRITCVLWIPGGIDDHKYLVASNEKEGKIFIWRYHQQKNSTGASASSAVQFDGLDPLTFNIQTSPKDFPTCMSGDAAGVRFAVGGSDGVIRIFTFEARLQELLQRKAISSMSNDDNDDDNDDDTISLDTMAQLQTPTVQLVAHLLHNGPIVDIQFSSCGTKIVATSEDAKAYLWCMDKVSKRWQSTELVHEPIWPTSTETIPSLSTTTTLTTAAPSINNGKKKRSKQHVAEILMITWLKGCARIVTTMNDGYIRIFSGEDGQLLTRVRGDNASAGPKEILTLEAHPIEPELFLTAVRQTGFAAIWHIKYPTPLWTHTFDYYVDDLMFAPDGNMMVVCEYDGRGSDASYRQFTRIFAIGRESIVNLPLEQFFTADLDAVDPSRDIPTLIGHSIAYHLEQPEFVQSRDGIDYSTQPPPDERLLRRAPPLDIDNIKLSVQELASLLLREPSNFERADLLSYDALREHAKRLKRKKRKKTPEQRDFTLDMLDYGLLIVDDSNDDDYHEGADAYQSLRNSNLGLHAEDFHDSLDEINDFNGLATTTSTINNESPHRRSTRSRPSVLHTPPEDTYGHTTSEAIVSHLRSRGRTETALTHSARNRTRDRNWKYAENSDALVYNNRRPSIRQKTRSNRRKQASRRLSGSSRNRNGQRTAQSLNYLTNDYEGEDLELDTNIHSEQSEESAQSTSESEQDELSIMLSEDNNDDDKLGIGSSARNLNDLTDSRSSLPRKTRSSKRQRKSVSNYHHHSNSNYHNQIHEGVEDELVDIDGFNTTVVPASLISPETARDTYPPWMTLTEPSLAFYHPQVNDLIAYIPEGHREFLDLVQGKNNLYAGDVPWTGVDDLVPSQEDTPWVFGRIDNVSVHVSMQANELHFVVTLTITPSARYWELPETEGEWNFSHGMCPEPITIRYEERDGFLDFVLLASRVVAGARSNFQPGDAVTVCFAEDNYPATVQHVRPGVWRNYEVFFVNADTMSGADRCSCWEMIRDSHFTSQMKKFAQEHLVVDDLLSDLVRMLSQRDSDPNGLSTKYVEGRPYWITLPALKRRLDSGFYRHSEQVYRDVRQLMMQDDGRDAYAPDVFQSIMRLLHKAERGFRPTRSSKRLTAGATPSLSFSSSTSSLTSLSHPPSTDSHTNQRHPPLMLKLNMEVLRNSSPSRKLPNVTEASTHVKVNLSAPAEVQPSIEADAVGSSLGRSLRPRRSIIMQVAPPPAPRRSERSSKTLHRSLVEDDSDDNDPLFYDFVSKKATHKQKAPFSSSSSSSASSHKELMRISNGRTTRNSNNGYSIHSDVALETETSEYFLDTNNNQTYSTRRKTRRGNAAGCKNSGSESDVPPADTQQHRRSKRRRVLHGIF